MARRVFFSFHYANDVWRSNSVRNSWVTQGKYEAGFSDAAEFEKIQRQGDAAIRRWIKDQMYGTSVTVVLIGSETLSRPWVRYEIMESVSRGNAVIGVRVNQLKDQLGNVSYSGDIYTIVYNSGSRNYTFNEIADEIHDYVLEDGYRNLGTWIESAARKHGK